MIILAPSFHLQDQRLLPDTALLWTCGRCTLGQVHQSLAAICKCRMVGTSNSRDPSSQGSGSHKPEVQEWQGPALSPSSDPGSSLASPSGCCLRLSLVGLEHGSRTPSCASTSHSLFSTEHPCVFFPSYKEPCLSI